MPSGHKQGLAYAFVALAPMCAMALPGMTIHTEQLPRAIKGVPYSAEIRVVLDGRCPIDDVRFSLASGTLPPGLQFSMNGLAGTPREIGAYRFAVHAANSCTATDQEIEVLVTGRPIVQVFPEAVKFQVTAGDTARRTEQVLVSSTWRSLPYLTSDAAERWLSVRPIEGVTPDERSPLTGDRLMLDIDPSKLEPGVHRQTITISAWQAANAATVEVIVTVAPPRPPAP
jgi:hypothetical protein